MSDYLSRRGFVASVAAGLLVARASGFARRLKIGHTGITWGYAPPNAEDAIRDVASLGYHGFESFGSVLDAWEAKGGLGRLLEAANLPLRSAYCPFELTNANVRRDEVSKAKRWGSLIKKYGGSVAVVGPNSVNRSSYTFRSNRAAIQSALADIGAALDDAGVVAAVHPHTGSCIQTADEVYGVMDGVDRRVGLAPDVGELLAGGADPLKIVQDLLPLVRHVHLKDFNAGATHDGYCPVGEGRVDFGAIVDVLERSTREPMLMVELNPAANGTSTRAPLETARASKVFLERLGYAFKV